MTDRGKLRCYLKSEVMHAIYATESSTNALTMEAGVVKIADGTDMAEGRARIPYKLGKIEMHAVSAISIKQVLIDKGVNVPVKIEIVMNDYAGLFQVEEVLKPKIETSGLADYIEVYLHIGEKIQKILPHSS